MIRENLRFHLWAFGSLRLLLSLLDEAKLAFQLSRFNFLRRKICRNMRNISLSWLQLNLTDRNFFLSFFSARDHIISFSNFVIIQWLKKEKKREKKQGISRVPESLWKKKRKLEREISCAERESRIHGIKESRKFAEYLKIESLDKTLGFLFLPRRIKDGTTLRCYKKHVYVRSSKNW